MSAFDDEFGLFGEDAQPSEEERRSTLGARKIASSETIIDDIEPEDEPAPRRRSGSSERFGERPRTFVRAPREPKDPAASQARATELLEFLARKLVSKPEAVELDTYIGDNGQPVLEMAVDPEDLGKVIGRGGRVAQALRTIVRATAEGKITVDILDTDELEEEYDDDEFEGESDGEPAEQ
ncbi:MAG: hypothetical protein DLM50_06205 [Candidatus Meridianibacter frigidus]|nr:MAG: hypothetical protein DLM50_06205 [Candidatus Eremiobacteraeota bacterium]